MKFFHNFYFFSICTHGESIGAIRCCPSVIVTGARQPNGLKKLFFQGINTFFELYALLSPHHTEFQVSNSVRYFSTYVITKNSVFFVFGFPSYDFKFSSLYECYKFLIYRKFPIYLVNLRSMISNSPFLTIF